MKIVETITSYGDVAEYKKAKTYYEDGEKFYEMDGNRYMCVEEWHDTMEGVEMSKNIMLRRCTVFPAAAQEDGAMTTDIATRIEALKRATHTNAGHLNEALKIIEELQSCSRVQYTAVSLESGTRAICDVHQGKGTFDKFRPPPYEFKDDFWWDMAAKACAEAWGLKAL